MWCSICYSDKWKWKIHTLQCGHFICCDCLPKLCRKRCPFCRSEIKSVVDTSNVCRSLFLVALFLNWLLACYINLYFSRNGISLRVFACFLHPTLYILDRRFQLQGGSFYLLMFFHQFLSLFSNVLLNQLF